jgi:hypothetical protein
VTNRSEEQPGLFDVTPPAWGVGGMEQATKTQLDKLRELGYIEDHHAGLVQLALVTARTIDRSEGKGAPSGTANLLRVMNEILESVPQPESASKDTLDAVVEALRHDEDVEGAIYYGDVRAGS